MRWRNAFAVQNRFLAAAKMHPVGLGLQNCFGRSSMRVLVVEDEPCLGAFLKKGMEMEGHRVEWVEDGEAALVQMAQNLPDLVLLDLSLPRRDGTEVLAEMQALHCDAAVLV